MGNDTVNPGALPPPVAKKSPLESKRFWSGVVALLSCGATIAQVALGGSKWGIVVGASCSSLATAFTWWFGLNADQKVGRNPRIPAQNQ